MNTCRKPIIHPPDWTPTNPTEPHEKPCRFCPSAMGSDPEADQILASGDAGWLRESMFPCGWRPEKFCRAWHDKITAALGALEGQP